ncbi:protein kinase domain protein [Ichthyophthirius multifiliis]|uniref:non-specific serine/threonine protein kinase n=1 Tax=Ichthyophthirius multifiliis TaxID=5932 RepID=G0R5E3_ICHMU|nr:protein kinase domain protein [Ichthyophthirius multifiliis]EGR27301.1 protein kinase domain protein [Ichthyophthirius multifiliis]|eukprot:XP_004024185.1 protein kinase domain protein [Ichthyophthirius multifiliis]
MKSFIILALFITLAFSNFSQKEAHLSLAEIYKSAFGSTILNAIQMNISSQATSDDIIALIDQILNQLQDAQIKKNTQNEVDVSNYALQVQQLSGRIKQTLDDTDTTRNEIKLSEENLEQYKLIKLQAESDYQNIVNSIEIGTAERELAHANWQESDSELAAALEAIDQANVLLQHLHNGVSFVQLSLRFGKVLGKLKNLKSKQSSLFRPVIMALSQIQDNLNYDKLQKIIELLVNLKNTLNDVKDINQKNETKNTEKWENRLNLLNNINKNMFNYQYVIGKGGFGKVWRVEHKKTKQIYAMKEMLKSKIITKRSVNSVMSERNLLSQLKHPFIVNMNYAFQDRDNLYLLMDLVNGGDLRFHIGRHRRFKENQTLFFVCCIILAFEYLHENNVIHRDVKPENLVLDTDGYVKLTDLGVARVWREDNAQDTSGTPGYMAPEVMCRQNHGIAVDYFALGVIAYEFMMGRRPYLGRNRKEIRDQILSKQVQIKKQEIPEGYSIEAADFINRCIQRKPANRLGVNGPQEVKCHPWFRNIEWNKLLNKQIQAPFIPIAIEDNYEYRQQISIDGIDSNEELIQQNALLLRKDSVQNLFAGYNFNMEDYVKQIGSTKNSTSTNVNTERTQSTLNSKKFQQDMS